MGKKEFDEFCFRTDRACDALVLGYSPEVVLARDFGRNFYIPSGTDVEKAFGEALRSIFGRKEGSSHWADDVKWATVKDLDKLEKRILEGTREVLIGDSDYQTIFESAFLSFSGRFESAFICGKGDLYRFRDGKRKEALVQFDKFWKSEEKKQWQEIHGFMREYTLNEFSKKTD